jgi:hypothetical protein
MVDRLLAGGSVSVRSIADRFGLAKTSLLRHRDTHLVRAVQRQLQRREREEQSAAEVWCGRLEDTYAAARRGLARTESDPERWAAGVGYLGALNKSIELGLKASGQIEGGRGTTKITIEHLVVLPQSVVPASVVAIDETTIDVKSLPTPEDEERVR